MGITPTTQSAKDSLWSDISKGFVSFYSRLSFKCKYYSKLGFVYLTTVKPVLMVKTRLVWFGSIPSVLCQSFELFSLEYRTRNSVRMCLSKLEGIELRSNYFSAFLVMSTEFSVVRMTLRFFRSFPLLVTIPRSPLKINHANYS